GQGEYGKTSLSLECGLEGRFDEHTSAGGDKPVTRNGTGGGTPVNPGRGCAQPERQASDRQPQEEARSLKDTLGVSGEARDHRHAPRDSRCRRAQHSVQHFQSRAPSRRSCAKARILACCPKARWYGAAVEWGCRGVSRIRGAGWAADLSRLRHKRKC